MQEKTSLTKSLVGQVVSTGMTKTVSVQVTTFKVHPLYHKRYRSTKKYLSATEQELNLGDTVRIEASRPLSARKRWVVAEVITAATPARQTTVKRVAKPKTTGAKRSGKGKKS